MLCSCISFFKYHLIQCFYLFYSVLADASFLDEWSLDQFKSILNRSNDEPNLKQMLVQDKIVIFLHLLGCDSNGHAHRPFSSIYLNNVKVVDGIAKSVYDLLENYFKDNRTAYIFTADHGMSDKGWKTSKHSTIHLPIFLFHSAVLPEKWATFVLYNLFKAHQLDSERSKV